MAYEIVEYRDEHEQAVAELAAALWQGNAAENAAHLRWKYRSTPLREHCHLFVVLSGAGVVGVRGLVGGRWEARGPGAQTPASFTAVSSADLVIAPDHRGTGLFRRLNATILERAGSRGHPLIFSHSATPAVAAALVATGWRRAFAINRCVRRVRPAIVRRTAARFGRDRAASIERLRCRERSSALGRMTVEAVAHAGDMAELVERAPWDGRLRQTRDGAFFRWRFDGPGVINRFVYCRENRTLRGYLVMQAKRRRPDAVTIVDFESDGDDVLAELFEGALAWARRFRMELWLDPLRERIGHRLARLGFDEVDETLGAEASGPALLLRVLDEATLAGIENAAGRRVAERADWDLRPAYSDAY